MRVTLTYRPTQLRTLIEDDGHDLANGNGTGHGRIPATALSGFFACGAVRGAVDGSLATRRRSRTEREGFRPSFRFAHFLSSPDEMRTAHGSALRRFSASLDSSASRTASASGVERVDRLSVRSREAGQAAGAASKVEETIAGKPDESLIAYGSAPSGSRRCIGCPFFTKRDRERRNRSARATTRSCRTRRGSSTTDTAASADSLRASPPTPPGGRARLCRGSSTCFPCARRRGCR